MTDLTSMSRDELEAHIKSLEKELSAAQKAMAGMGERERKAALAAAEKVAKDHGYSLAELTAGAGPAPKGRKGKGGAPKSTGKAKFRDPETGKTWTGKGRPPAWIREADAAGRPREDFAI